MAYRWKHKEPVARAVPRIARQQIDKALEALANERDPGEAVHDARTSIKRLRGLLRLVHPWLGQEEKRASQKLRKVAHLLGDLRDAEVTIQTFDRLWKRFENELGPAVGRIRVRLLHRLRGVEGQLDRPARLQRAARGFRKLRKRTRRWVPRHGRKDGGWRAIEGGLVETYAEGRRWLRRARKAGPATQGQASDETFHRWRREVKHHGYHLQLFTRAATPALAARAEALAQLGELLGEDHDLAIFRDTLADEPTCFESASDQRRLFACIAARQQALREEALPLGARVYAESPRAFCKHMRRSWRAWRRADKPQPVEADDHAGDQVAAPGAAQAVPLTRLLQRGVEEILGLHSLGRRRVPTA